MVKYSELHYTSTYSHVGCGSWCQSLDANEPNAHARAAPFAQHGHFREKNSGDTKGKTRGKKKGEENCRRKNCNCHHKQEPSVSFV